MSPVIPSSPADLADDVVQLLAVDGSWHGEAPSADELVQLYEQMSLARDVNQHVAQLHQQGRLPLELDMAGQEAAVVASAAALRPADWLFPSYRDVGAALFRGMPLEHYAASLSLGGGGVAAASGSGRQLPGHFSYKAGQVASVGSIVGSRLVHAVGVCWAAAMQGDDAAALVLFSEPESHSDGFHNGMNFAGVFGTSTIMLCRNDRWAGASSEPRPPVLSQATKADAYGMHAVRCDGNDPLAVLKCVREAVARRGPTLIDALTTPLDGSEAAAERDPLRRTRLCLEQLGAWDDTREKELQNELEARAELAFEATQSHGDGDPGAMMNEVFAQPPWHLRQQRQTLLDGPRPDEP